MSGLAGFLLIAVAALVVVAGRRSEVRSKVTKVGFASPEKPTDYGWNQQGFIGAKKAAAATGPRCSTRRGPATRTSSRTSSASRSAARI